MLGILISIYRDLFQSQNKPTSSFLIVSGECSGWHEYGDWRYYVYDEAVVDFWQANETCVSMGIQLTSIHSQEEQEFLAGIY